MGNCGGYLENPAGNGVAGWWWDASGVGVVTWRTWLVNHRGVGHAHESVLHVRRAGCILN